MPKDGKELENLAYLVHKSLSPDAKVTLNERVTGKKTKSSRQLDITIRQRIGLTDLLIVVECKDHSRPIDSPEVGSFISSLQDVGAQKGIMVSRKGFTEWARNLALEPLKWNRSNISEMKFQVKWLESFSNPNHSATR